MPALLKATATSAWKMELTPPTSASGMSPRQIARQARSRATSDDEQAVSTDRLGPRRSNRYDTRFDAMLSACPVLVCMSASYRPRFWMSP